MKPRFIILFFCIVVAIGLFFIVIGKLDFLSAIQKEAQESAHSPSVSAASSPLPARNVLVQEPTKNTASAGNISTDNSAYVAAQKSGSIENMEPWADKPSPHMKALGEPAKARATVKEKSFNLVPNQMGIFQRVYVASRAEIAVQVDYPKASAGEPVVIQVQDGGQLENGTVADIKEISDGHVQFNFQATEHPGIHRVSLRKGSDVKTLDFWVGPPLPVRAD